MEMGLVNFPRHHLAKCENRACRGCHLCEGGLALCTRCGGYEGSMPSDCPGEKMQDCVELEVYRGTLDYRRKEGWTQRRSRTWEGIVQK
jgi:hypothetical protein